MPVTKTAKRALRSSRRKKNVNDEVFRNLEIAIRQAKKSRKAETIIKAFSLTDKAVKKHLIHKNKAARIKSSLSKINKDIFKKKSTSSIKNPSKKK